MVYYKVVSCQAENVGSNPVRTSEVFQIHVRKHFSSRGETLTR